MPWTEWMLKELQHTQSRKPRLLVVDDQPMNVKLLADVLTVKGYAVITAESGQRALDLMRSDKPDLVLLDVMMPEVDGFETCRRFKADPRLRHIPIVFITALSDLGSEVEGLVESGEPSGLSDAGWVDVEDRGLHAQTRALRLQQEAFHLGHVPPPGPGQQEQRQRNAGKLHAQRKPAHRRLRPSSGSRARRRSLRRRTSRPRRGTWHAVASRAR